VFEEGEESFLCKERKKRKRRKEKRLEKFLRLWDNISIV